MAVPTAPVEAGGDKVLFLTYDLTGNNAPALMRGVRERTVNGNVLAYLGIATHADEGAWVAGDPVVAIAGVEGSTVRKMAVDAGGRPILRPMGAYNSGGSNAFGHPFLVAGENLNGEQAGWLAVGSHEDASTFDASDAVLVTGGVQSGGSTVRKLAVDSTGRTIGTHDLLLAGMGHVSVSASEVALRASSTPCRLIEVSADESNTAPVYLGLTGVTADGSGTTGGYRLKAGSQLRLPATNLNAVFAISTAAVGLSFAYWT